MKIERILIKALCQIQDRQALQAEYDAHFDGGKWSSQFHQPSDVAEPIRRLLEQLNVATGDAFDMLEAWAKKDKTPERPWDPMPIAIGCLMFIQSALAFPDEME